MIAEIFNSSLISGPETLVLPNLKLITTPFCIIWLKEERISSDKNNQTLEYFKMFADVHIISVHKRRDTKAAKELRIKLEELKITIAHAHDVKATYILHLGGISPLYKRISTHHGVHARSLFIVKLYEQFYCRFVLPKMDKVLIVCSSDKHILLSRGVPEEKIIVHLNGVDRPKIEWEKRTILKKKILESWGIKLNPGEKIYGIVARLAKEKDHKLALKIFSATRDLSYRVLCFGVGPEEDYLKKMTKKLGLQDKVIWMGYQKTISLELAALDGVLSFSSAEGLPINLIEAGWASTPVLARIVDGIADLLPSNEYGKCFPKNASLNYIEKEFRKFHKESGEKQAKSFFNRIENDFSGRTWAKKMDNIIEILSDKQMRDS